MKNYLLALILLLSISAAFAQTGKKPLAKEKPPTQKEMDDMMKEMKNAMDEMSPEDKKAMDSMGIKMPDMKMAPVRARPSENFIGRDLGRMLQNR